MAILADMCCFFLAGLAIMCTFSRVELGSSEIFEIYPFLQNMRTKINDMSWMIVDMLRYLTRLQI